MKYRSLFLQHMKIRSNRSQASVAFVIGKSSYWIGVTHGTGGRCWVQNTQIAPSPFKTTLNIALLLATLYSQCVRHRPPPTEANSLSRRSHGFESSRRSPAGQFGQWKHTVGALASEARHLRESRRRRGVLERRSLDSKPLAFADRNG